MFHREPISVNGELIWFTKSRFRGKKRHSSFTRTTNISLEGAKLELDGLYEFSNEAKAHLQLGITSSDITILECIHHKDTTTLRVVYKAPSTEFIAFVEQQLPTITPDREFFEGKWIQR